MGRRNQGQGQLFYEFRLDEAVPEDHLVSRDSVSLGGSPVPGPVSPPRDTGAVRSRKRGCVGCSSLRTVRRPSLPTTLRESGALALRPRQRRSAGGADRGHELGMVRLANRFVSCNGWSAHVVVPGSVVRKGSLVEPVQTADKFSGSRDQTIPKYNRRDSYGYSHPYLCPCVPSRTRNGFATYAQWFRVVVRC
jgi:hypothetical protein